MWVAAFLATAFLAVSFQAAAFLSIADLATAFLAINLLATVFLDFAFLATAILALALLAVAFLAITFLASAFLAIVFLATAFLTAGLSSTSLFRGFLFFTDETSKRVLASPDDGLEAFFRAPIRAVFRPMVLMLTHIAFGAPRRQRSQPRCHRQPDSQMRITTAPPP